MVKTIIKKNEGQKVIVTAVNGSEKIDIETYALIVPGQDFVVQINKMTDEDCLHSMCALIEGVVNHVAPGMNPWIKNALQLYANDI